MITSLTPEQEAKIPSYVEKWLKIGLSTERVDLEVAKKVGEYYYKNIIDKPVPEIKLMPSPFACWKHVCDTYKKKLDFIWPYLSGSFDASYFSYYDYAINELGIKIDVPHFEWYMSTVNCGPIFTLDDMCLVSDRPTVIKMVNGLLHCDGGASIEYSDGVKVYSLNGVMVDEYLATTKWNELDCSKLLQITNAEVRREFVRKAGIEQVMTALNAKVIDKQDDYELLLLDLGDGRRRPYLKMINPSVGTYHIEGVEPSCETVAAALKFRNGTDEKPVVLT